MLTKSAESWKIMFRKWGKANKQGTLGYRASHLQLQETSEGTSVGMLGQWHSWWTWSMGFGHEYL